MPKTKEVVLKSPITAHDKVVSKITLREPKFSEYIALGDPLIIARNADGSLFPVENGEVVQRYIEACCTDVDPLLLGELGLADAMAVKAAVLDFFSDAQASTSKAPATSSSST